MIKIGEYFIVDRMPDRDVDFSYFNTINFIVPKYQQCNSSLIVSNSLVLSNKMLLRCIKKSGHSGMHKAVEYRSYQVAQWDDQEIEVKE